MALTADIEDDKIIVIHKGRKALSCRFENRGFNEICFSDIHIGKSLEKGKNHTKDRAMPFIVYINTKDKDFRAEDYSGNHPICEPTDLILCKELLVDDQVLERLPA